MTDAAPIWGARTQGDTVPEEQSMMDLFYLALIAALFVFSLWMIRAFDRMS